MEVKFAKLAEPENFDCFQYLHVFVFLESLTQTNNVIS